MRIHFGVSKFIRPSSLIKILGALFVGLLAFFGITNHQIVYADTLNFVPSTFYSKDNSSNTNYQGSFSLVPSSAAGGNVYRGVPNSIYPGILNTFWFNYNPISSICSNQDYLATVSFKVFSAYDTTVYAFNELFIEQQNGTRTNLTCSNNNNIYTCEGTFKVNQYFSVKGSFVPGYSTPHFDVSQTWDYNCSSDNASIIINNDNQNTQNIINNQNENTQHITDSIDSVNDSITDTTTPSNNEIATVFGVSLQDHGLTSIAIAPIRLLSNLLDSNSSCTPLSFDITLGSMTKNVSIPSGCILWGNAPSSIVSIYQTVVYGLLGFYVLLDMYKFLSNLIDPENKDIYFLDL